MDTKKVIDNVESAFWAQDSEFSCSKKDHDDFMKEMNEAINLLKRGEKFKKIVEELNNLDFMSNKEKLLMNYEDFANLLTKLKQKYFPKDEVVK